MVMHRSPSVRITAYDIVGVPLCRLKCVANQYFVKNNSWSVSSSMRLYVKCQVKSGLKACW